MYGVLVGLLPELEGEEGELAPRHVLLHVDLVLILAQVGVPLAPDRLEVDLRPGRQVDVPQLGVAGALGVALEGVPVGPQEVATGEAAERPTTRVVVAHRDFEPRLLLLLVLKKNREKAIYTYTTNCKFSVSARTCSQVKLVPYEALIHVDSNVVGYFRRNDAILFEMYIFLMVITLFFSFQIVRLV